MADWGSCRSPPNYGAAQPQLGWVSFLYFTKSKFACSNPLRKYGSKNWTTDSDDYEEGELRADHYKSFWQEGQWWVQVNILLPKQTQALHCTNCDDDVDVTQHDGQVGWRSGLVECNAWSHWSDSIQVPLNNGWGKNSQKWQKHPFTLLTKRWGASS